MNYLLKSILLTLLFSLTLFANSFSFDNRQDFYMADENFNEYEISFSFNKDKFLTIQDDSNILLWNLKTGLPIKDFGKVDYIYKLKKSKDNRYILIHSILDGNDSIKLVDMKEEKIDTIASKLQVEGSSYRTDISRDGKYFIFTWGDCSQKIIKVFDIEKKEVINTFSTHTPALLYVKISPKNNFIATTARENYFNLWSMEGKKLFEFKFPETKGYRRYYSLDISDDGKYILVGESIFDVEKRKFIKKFISNPNNIFVSFTEDSNKILFHKKGDANISFWDINKSKISSYFSDKEGNITNVYKVENRRYFKYQLNTFLGDKYKSKIFDSKNHKALIDINNSIQKYTFLDTKNYILWHDNKMFYLFDLKNKKKIKSFEIEKKARIANAIISKNAKYIASVSSDNTVVLIWDVEGNKLLHLIVENNNTDLPLTFNSTGDYFIIFSNDKLKIFDTKKGSLLKSIKVSDKYLSFDKLYLTYNDKYLIMKDYDNKFVWDFEKSQFRKSNSDLPQSYDMMFSQGDKKAITIVDDNQIKLYDMNHIEAPIKAFILGTKNSWVVFDYKNKKIYKDGDGKFLFKRESTFPLFKNELELIK